MTNSEFILEERAMRFNKVLLTAFVGASVSLFAGLANADVANHVIALSANVPTSCSISGSASVDSGPFSEVSQTASKFTVSVTGTTANATTGILTLGSIVCSSSNINVTMTPNGWIKHTNSSINSKITYTATIIDDGTEIGASVISSINGNSPRTVNISGNQSLVGIKISTDQVSNLQPGQYSGTLTISINPS